jgi:hypothetical protein
VSDALSRTRQRAGVGSGGHAAYDNDDGCRCSGELGGHERGKQGFPPTAGLTGWIQHANALPELGQRRGQSGQLVGRGPGLQRRQDIRGGLQRRREVLRHLRAGK